ncbi:hypothetical protein RRG08_056056 [Elysia crispata]|uniref:Uncharacterized protein n=1 Tax=Elysia crispata TaxID=231223 RepID=A0AAE1DDF6_9GAST|nr:hypothetical protein RRG08_056056 [Elysia crispata]
MIRVKKMESCRSKTNTNDIETQNTTIDTSVAAQYLITNISFISKLIFSGERSCRDSYGDGRKFERSRIDLQLEMRDGDAGQQKSLAFSFASLPAILENFSPGDDM